MSHPRTLARGALSLAALLCALVASDAAAQQRRGPAACAPNLAQVGDQCGSPVALGAGHVCALSSQGRASCWGFGATGALGRGDLEGRITPGAVTGSARYSSIAAGSMYTCGVRRDGGVDCWGGARNGESDGPARSATPAAVPGLSAVTAVSIGGSHACALTSAGSVLCWGRNVTASTEASPDGFSATPLAVPGLGSALSIACGDLFSCALGSDGAVRCWGPAAHRTLGVGDPSVAAWIPVQAPGWTEVAAMTAGADHICALMRDGSVQCRGRWQGLDARVATPATVPGLVDVAAIAAGGNHTCALLRDGRVRCWGEGAQGQLGQGAARSSAAPVDVGLEGVVAIAPGGNHTCALLRNRQLSCWGASRNVPPIANEARALQATYGREANALRPVLVPGFRF